MNCWHASSLYAAQVFATNGQTYAIDASGTGYSYADYPTNSWTAHPEWGVVYGLQYGGDGNLYSLYGPGGGACINQGQHSVGRWNGPGWTQLTYCMGSFSVAADGGGQMLAIDGNGTLWIATNYGNSAWVHAAIPGFPVIAATSINSNLGTYAVILHDNTIWAYNGSSWSQLTSNGRAKQITADSLGTLYVIGMDNNVYHYNGSGWDRLNGGGNTFLANGGSMEVWAIGPASGGNSVYRFSDTGLQHTRMVSGSSTCNGNLCPLASHSATVKAGWGSKCSAPS